MRVITPTMVQCRVCGRALKLDQKYNYYLHSWVRHRVETHGLEASAGLKEPKISGKDGNIREAIAVSSSTDSSPHNQQQSQPPLLRGPRTRAATRMTPRTFTYFPSHTIRVNNVQIPAVSIKNPASDQARTIGRPEPKSDPPAAGTSTLKHLKGGSTNDPDSAQVIKGSETPGAVTTNSSFFKEGFSVPEGVKRAAFFEFS